MIGRGGVWCGGVSQGMAGVAWRDAVRYGGVRFGRTWYGRLGWEWLGWQGMVRCGWPRHGWARCGESWQAGLGLVR